MKTRTVLFLLFDDVEPLDFAGPYEVFCTTGRRQSLEPFRPATVAATRDAVRARGGLRVLPDYSFSEAPEADILLIPGGFGTRRLMGDEVVIDWIRRAAAGAELVLSVCTGALLLGRAGLLDGLDATTHYLTYDLLREVAPEARVRPGARFLDNGKIIVSAGVSAGIDMSFHVVERLLGPEAAAETARYIEYEYWNGSTGGQPPQPPPLPDPDANPRTAS